MDDAGAHLLQYTARYMALAVRALARVSVRVQCLSVCSAAARARRSSESSPTHWLSKWQCEKCTWCRPTFWAGLSLPLSLFPLSFFLLFSLPLSLPLSLSLSLPLSHSHSLSLPLSLTHSFPSSLPLPSFFLFLSLSPSPLLCSLRLIFSVKCGNGINSEPTFPVS